MLSLKLIMNVCLFFHLKSHLHVNYFIRNRQVSNQIRLFLPNSKNTTTTQKAKHNYSIKWREDVKDQ